MVNEENPLIFLGIFRWHRSPAGCSVELGEIGGTLLGYRQFYLCLVSPSTKLCYSLAKDDNNNQFICSFLTMFNVDPDNPRGGFSRSNWGGGSGGGGG